MGGAGALTPGQIFAGRYRVEAVLGQSTAGTVYRVVDTDQEQLVALKILTLAGDGEKELERFRRGVRLARRISHPNVARTFEHGSVGAQHYLTMELVDGLSLRDVLAQRSPLPVSEALDIAAQLSDGLAAAHRAGVVHRDLKPANVLVEASGRVVISDFGIAREAGTDHSGGAVGTPRYMAPEQLLGEPVDGRTDLFALGLILFEMLSGKSVEWHGGAADSGVLARVRGVPEDVREHAEVDPVLSKLVFKLLAADPRKRPPDAVRVALALRALLAGKDARPHVDTLVPPASGDSRDEAPVDVLAVLPLVCRGDAEPELGVTLAADIAAALANLGGVCVLTGPAAARFEAGDEPAVVGEMLGAAFVLDGSVAARDGALKITLRLVEVASNVEMWRETCDAARGDLQGVQGLVCRRVAEVLKRRLSSA
jgi:serine/threonine-protein kinase